MACAPEVRLLLNRQPARDRNRNKVSRVRIADPATPRYSCPAGHEGQPCASGRVAWDRGSPLDERGLPSAAGAQPRSHTTKRCIGARKRNSNPIQVLGLDGPSTVMPWKCDRARASEPGAREKCPTGRVDCGAGRLAPSRPPGRGPVRPIPALFVLSAAAPVEARDGRFAPADAWACRTGKRPRRHFVGNELVDMGFHLPARVLWTFRPDASSRRNGGICGRARDAGTIESIRIRSGNFDSGASGGGGIMPRKSNVPFLFRS